MNLPNRAVNAKGVVAPQILLVGSSVRAAAQSAHRAGYQVFAVDQFADVDLRAVGPAIRARPFPALLRELAGDLPRCPWLYTGPLENHPELLEQLSEGRPLWGNPAGVVRAARDPWKLGQALRRAGLRVPEVRSRGDDLPPGVWLRKPFRSGGGRGVSVMDRRAPLRQDDYVQQRIAGPSYAAVYVAADRNAVLLGVTRQLVGCGWAGAQDYWYTGSVGPLVIPHAWQEEFLRIGRCLAREFSLRGLFAVDAVVNARGVWTVELNPRYSASVEVLERAFACSVLAWHVEACRAERLPPCLPTGITACWAKAILYARRPLTLGRAWADFVQAKNAHGGWPLLADIPAVGERLRRCSPIATLFAQGSSAAEATRRLRRFAYTVHTLLGNLPGAGGG